MGVPKFFRYISERYPCLSEFARDQHMPEFDNLYLDMNGIIHTCSHPDDGNVTFYMSEEEMFKAIFNYIDKLFFLIKPQRLFYMAVDGVAPRAKMNQQRSRRFRSAKESQLQEQIARRKGIEVPKERFDTNCITPGTEFMNRLQTALRYFVKCKISADPLWQRCRVILSGQETPGEGEHKIMDYIRFLRSEKGYDPNTRHCLYGLDADLIILGLCTHELHFVILREEVKFTKSTKRSSLEETRFILLHLSLLREYIELDFKELQDHPNFNLGDLIDDWVLMGFLVGNDFIPHLPCLHIASNALPLLYKAYKDVFPTLGGNINEHGTLNLERLEKYFEILSEVELDIFQQKYADLKYFQTKQNKNNDEAFNFDVNDIKNSNLEDGDFGEMNEASCQLYNDEDDLSDDSQHLMDEFESYKRDYYMNKMHKNDTNSDLQSLKEERTVAYISALQWILDYYYRGVQSWGWYYPYHYAPFVSDLRNFQDLSINFDMGKPFLPFQQLLAVLPASSKSLLPAAYHDLMTSPNSQIIHYYPDDFETDLNGKQHDWEAVVLIPFIDENVLLNAMETCNSFVTPEEQRRNRHGPMYEYEYTEYSHGPLEALYSLKPLAHVYCTETAFLSKDIAIYSNESVFLELPSANHTVFLPGFPTMKHLEVEFELMKAGITVFSYPSRNDNMILKPVRRKDYDNVFMVAEKFLNQVVYIGWPHLIKAKVVAIFNREKYIDSDGFSDMMAVQFDAMVNTLNSHLQFRMGIDFGELNVLVKVRTYVGSKMNFNFNGRVTRNDSWSENVIPYPAQGLVSKISVYNEATLQYQTIEHLHPEKSKIFFIGNPYYGSEGTVLNPLLVYECGRLKVNITVLPEPNLEEAKFLQSTLEENYISSYDAATVLGVNVKAFNRITACLLVVVTQPSPKRHQRVKGGDNNNNNNYNDPDNLINIGLQFKNLKNRTQLIGYAKYVDGHWRYSTTAINLAEEYCRLFPEIVKWVNQCDRRYKVAENEIFPGNPDRLQEVRDWLEEKGYLQSEVVDCGCELLQKEVVDNILGAIEQLKILPVKTVKLQVKPHLLIKPDITLPEVYKASRSIRLFDRIVIVRSTYMVPLGARGTVVGIFQDTDKNPVRIECLHTVAKFYDILFDKQVPNGSDLYGIAKGRVQRIPEAALLLTTPENNRIGGKQFRSKLDEQIRMERLGGGGGGQASSPQSNPIGMETNNNQQQSGEKYAFSNREHRSVNATSGGGFSTPRRPEENFWRPEVQETTYDAHKPTSTPLGEAEGEGGDPLPELLSPSPNCQKETMMLKNLLGISGGGAATPQGQRAKEHLKKNGGNDGFLEPCAPQLPPQPPTSWFQSSQSVSVAPITTIQSSRMAAVQSRIPPMGEVLPPPLPSTPIYHHHHQHHQHQPYHHYQHPHHPHHHYQQPQQQFFPIPQQHQQLLETVGRGVQSMSMRNLPPIPAPVIIRSPQHFQRNQPPRPYPHPYPLYHHSHHQNPYQYLYPNPPHHLQQQQQHSQYLHLDEFVPLQVARKSRQHHPMPTSSSTDVVVRSIPQRSNNNKITANNNDATPPTTSNANVEDHRDDDLQQNLFQNNHPDVPPVNNNNPQQDIINSEDSNNLSQIGEEQLDRNQKNGERKPPRTPRIAARFDKL